MRQADAVKTGKGRLSGFPGEQAGEVCGGEPQPACQFLHGKAPVKMLLHISDPLRHRSRWLEKGRRFQRAQEAGKETIDQLAALIVFQLTALPKLAVQIQPQKDGKAVRRQGKAGSAAVP